MTTQTRNCIVCGRRAVRWSGHVHRGDVLVTAGRCKTCDWRAVTCAESQRPRGKQPCEASWACYGHWTEADGLEGDE